ncbi:MAG: Jag N-terminal domain-containing protein [Deltaproteobacteria bacterium]|nr:Jag N-terminal domain-containing protein [Deltaproteobacteria bacterium]MBW2099170.1 Jag N-terminal domain-containing protein [Deltaproteobacteria bacterium]
MKPCLEFEGKNVDYAIEKACEELQLTKDKLKYDVISHGSSGIFGLVGAKKARIRVAAPELSTEIANKKSPSDDISFKPEFKDECAVSLVDEAFNKPEQKGVSEELLNVGEDTIQKIVDLITTDARVSAKRRGDRILYNIEGGNSGILIGKRGQTLEAIQYIVDKVVNKKSIDKRIRVQIDVHGYLETKKASLQRLAVKLAEKAKHTGKPTTIGQMNAHDRRIVHLSLKNDKEVRTQSMGEGYYRKLVIFPKKNNNNGKNSLSN